ncbi:MAG TPA: glutamine-hydrolyzing GMP synthase [Candidatus Deferrimicrobium sp.]|nr:glutamine-hydrolyzing GMP synthase [Candidatus Deferrimicrobium sp.]
MVNSHTILVIDFGGQYTQLIARRIRQLSVYSEILSYNATLKEIESFKPKGIILSGGPKSVYAKGSPIISKEIFIYCKERSIPILGICYGLQLIGQIFGGKIESHPKGEYGKVIVDILKQEGLFQGLSPNETVWMSHGDQIIELPPNFETIAFSETCPIAAIQNTTDQVFAVQFHPEVSHSPNGMIIFKNFIFDICKCEPNWKMTNFINDSISKIQEIVKIENLIMGVSGGVDSTVVATLIEKAIGDRIFCIFVDNGLMRKNEVAEVEHSFQKILKFKHFFVEDASKLFLSRLQGIIDPEEKRRIIAYTFIEVFEAKAEELKTRYGAFKFLGQGTIAPDRIESGVTSNSSAKIKSHHNVTLPEKMKLQVIEPLSLLYKDEVREVGKELGIPRELIERHPFPGPSLAIRIIGDVTPDKLQIVRESDAILIEELKNDGVYNMVWQAFTGYLPIKSVGVMGDARTYQNMVLIRIIESQDAMTANFAKIDWNLLERIASRIINEVPGVNRVVYDVSNKPPATVELE